MLSGSVDVLVRFARLASEASTGAEILPLLAGAAIEHVKADGAAVVEVTPAGARVAAAKGVPESVVAWAGDAELIGDELGTALLGVAGGTFARAVALPLVSSGGLFGALVLLFATDRPLDAKAMHVADGLADLGGIALARIAQIAKLVQTNEELRASRAALAKTEKLRALGQMAAGVSHDLKNLLNPLSMHVQLAQRALAKGEAERARESLEEIKQVIRRGVETVERLRTFSRQAPEARAVPVDVSALAREAVAIARPRMSSGAGRLSLIVEELEAVPPVVGHADAIITAVVNLVVNAIDALPVGGTIGVRTGAERGRVFVRVADDGPGMSTEVQARVFEPFFTTKGNEGTGLGLAMVFATMERHGGTVSLDTAEGKGAIFTLWFPPAAAP